MPNHQVGPRPHKGLLQGRVFPSPPKADCKDGVFPFCGFGRQDVVDNISDIGAPGMRHAALLNGLEKRVGVGFRKVDRPSCGPEDAFLLLQRFVKSDNAAEVGEKAKSF